MDWQQRASIIRWNPVTAVRQFHYRVQKFLHIVLKSPAQPIGHVVHYFIRVEMQQRGSPHIHVLIWIQDAPIVGEKPDSEVCEFIDQYITCTPPDNDEELKQIVKEVQTHTHSVACRKQGKACRFNFPKEPSFETVFAHSNKEIPKDQSTEIESTLKKVYAELNDDQKEMKSKTPTRTWRTLGEILEVVDVTSEEYMEVLRKSKNRSTVILKRQPSQCCVNNFNIHLLKAWEANMDIQFCCDAYACAKYILSYISKPEREEGEMLKRIGKEGNPDNKRAIMRAMGNAVLNNRAVSAQEAVLRECSIPLKMCDTAVVHVNTSFPEDRSRIFKSMTKMKTLGENSKRLVEINNIERYQARPASLENMCLEEFAKYYRLQGTSVEENDICEDNDPDDQDDDIDPTSPKVTLKNRMGTMVRRKRPAVLRTPRFSQYKDPEKYYHSILVLYLPWREETEDLLGGYDCYEDHYYVVHDQIEITRNQYERNMEVLDQALEELDEKGLPEKWDNIAAEIEKEKLQDKAEGVVDSEQHAIVDPTDLKIRRLPEMQPGGLAKYDVQLDCNQMDDESYRDLIRSLNTKQRSVFDYVLQWCRELSQ
jgi:hypothetical protein